jgi:thiamine-phosphate diphosphorylase
VTDRHRLAPGVEDLTVLVDCLRRQVEWAVAAGIDAVQIRERDLEAGPLVRLTETAVAAGRGSQTKVLVNDRLDVALAAGADGVHLRADSPPAWRIRPLVPKSFVIGRSVHGLDELQAAGDVDYLIAGTLWATPSKPGGHPLLGLGGMARLVRAARVPVLAIGGIDIGRAAEVAAAGAAGIAAIGLFIDQRDQRDQWDRRDQLDRRAEQAGRSWARQTGACRACALSEVTRALRASFAHAVHGQGEGAI